MRSLSPLRPGVRARRVASSQVERSGRSGPGPLVVLAVVAVAAVLSLTGCGTGAGGVADPTGSTGSTGSTGAPAGGPMGGPAGPSAGAASSDGAAGRPRLLLTGDSVGLFVGTSITPITDELGIDFENKSNWVCGIVKVPRYRHAGGTITDAGANCYWPEAWAGETLPRFRPDVVLVVQGGTGLGDWEVEGDFRGPCDPVFDRWYTDALGAELDRLGSTGADVVVTTEPYPRLFPQPPDLDARTDCANRSTREAAAAHGATVVDLAAFVCPDGRCLVEKDGVTLRPDGVHFTKAGADYLARWLVPRAFEAAGRPVPTPSAPSDRAVSR